jgi:hypothetical protein
MRIAAAVTITAATAIVAIALLSAPVAAQETKPAPKGSVRVLIPGCTKGYIFTAGPRTGDHPGNVDIPAGLHIRMNGPKKVIAEIKAHEGSMIELTGLMKTGQYNPGGVGIGGGVRMSPGPGVSQSFIDVEGWRQIPGSCPSR